MAPKKQLVHPRLLWVNTELGVSLKSVEEIANGVIPCHVLDKFVPRVLHMNRLKADAKSESEFISNYKVLQEALRYMKVAKIIDVPRLAQGRAGACIDLLQFLESFCFDVRDGKTAGLVLDARKTGNSTARMWTATPSSSRGNSPPPARANTAPKTRPSSAVVRAKSPMVSPRRALPSKAPAAKPVGKATDRPTSPHPTHYVARTTAAATARAQAVAATLASSRGAAPPHSGGISPRSAPAGATTPRGSPLAPPRVGHLSPRAPVEHHGWRQASSSSRSASAIPALSPHSRLYQPTQASASRAAAVVADHADLIHAERAMASDRKLAAAMPAPAPRLAMTSPRRSPAKDLHRYPPPPAAKKGAALVQVEGMVEATLRAVEQAVAALTRALPELGRMRRRIGVEGRDTAEGRSKMHRRADMMALLLHSATALTGDIETLMAANMGLASLELSMAAEQMDVEEQQLLSVRTSYSDEMDMIANKESQHRTLPWQKVDKKESPGGKAEKEAAPSAELRQLDAALQAVGEVNESFTAYNLLMNPLLAPPSSPPLTHPLTSVAPTFHHSPSPALSSKFSPRKFSLLTPPPPALAPRASPPPRAMMDAASPAEGEGLGGDLGHTHSLMSYRASYRVPCNSMMGEEDARSVVTDGSGTGGEQVRHYAFKNGDTFEGQYQEGKRTGLGVYAFWSGDQYQGRFLDGQVCGHGVYKFANKGSYEGQWEGTKYAGCGVESWARGSVYGGHFQAGHRQGYGACKYHNGDSYAGQWAEGHRHGLGLQKCADGSHYLGEYAKGKRHGNGQYTFANGDRYCGEYKDDRVHGVGVYYFANGQVYEGRWVSGKKAGPLLYTVETGQCFAAEFSDRDLLWCERLDDVAVAGKTTKGDCAYDDLMTLVTAARQMAADAGAQAEKYWDKDGEMQRQEAAVSAAVALASDVAKASAAEAQALTAANKPI